ncbi:hypothetical protein [Streptomyces sp. ICBB 8177]|uniref:hypothetical protein n=1 Tax=Streptomyces sp. ICBB 8177 TaxID=563922 RepID=UPI001F53E639|nr:hypothetical protein [Streptomyces sp. ICBB 8177]
MNAVRHLLVLPDRDAARDAAEAAAERFDLEDDPQVVREALAGDDDAEDAQWLVVIEDPASALTHADLDALACEYDGWHEEE